MDSPGSSHNENVGDLSDEVYAILTRLRGLDWGAVETLAEARGEYEEDLEEDPLLQERDAAIAALTTFSNSLNEAMYT